MHSGGAHFGMGSGSILLDDVDCLGSEPNLGQCLYYDYPTPGSHNCGHHEDASVVCTNRSKYFNESNIITMFMKCTHITIFCNHFIG